MISINNNSGIGTTNFSREINLIGNRGDIPLTSFAGSTSSFGAGGFTTSSTNPGVNSLTDTCFSFTGFNLLFNTFNANHWNGGLSTTLDTIEIGIGGGNIAILPLGYYGICGRVSNLRDSGLVLRNINLYNLAIDVNGGFAFANGILNGRNYNVIVQTQPSNPDQVCTITNGSGAVNNNEVLDILVNCVDVDSCNTRTASGIASTVDEVFEACEQLTADASFYIDQNAAVVLAAGEGVTLNSGFTIEQGGILQAKVCGQSLCQISPEPMEYGCHSCVTQICDVDASCCTDAFTQACQDMVSSVCGLTCE